MIIQTEKRKNYIKRSTISWVS